jgi:hypothetical protein
LARFWCLRVNSLSSLSGPLSSLEMVPASCEYDGGASGKGRFAALTARLQSACFLRAEAGHRKVTAPPDECWRRHRPHYLLGAPAGGRYSPQPRGSSTIEGQSFPSHLQSDISDIFNICLLYATVTYTQQSIWFSTLASSAPTGSSNKAMEAGSRLLSQ